jgi:hypothetical protein
MMIPSDHNHRRTASGAAPDAAPFIIIIRPPALPAPVRPDVAGGRASGTTARRRTVWPSWGDALLLAATVAILTLALLSRPDLTRVIGARMAPLRSVGAPDAAFPYRLRHPPTITAATYRAALAEANHPMAAEADDVYDLLAASGVDPAVELALALAVAAMDPDAVQPPPVGGRNVHGMLRPDGAPATYATYRDAAAAWVDWVYAASAPPESADAPLTVAGVVALACAAPCPADAALAALTRAIDAWRAADAPRRR